MRLWSIQTPDVWELLQRDGVYRLLAPGSGAVHYAAPYRWMARQLALRVGPPPVPGAWPLWAWCQWQGRSAPRPDLRSRGYLPAGTPGVRITLDLDPATMLLSDFGLWHYVLNDWYLPASEADGAAFAAELARRQLTPDRTALPESARKHIAASWERIFDLEWADDVFTEPPHRKSIQAVCWELRLEHVRHVDLFRAR